MVIVVPVDGSKLSQKCFDMSLRFAKSGDVVWVVHVINTDKSALKPNSEDNPLLGDSAVRMYYSTACSKATFERGDAVEFSFAEVRCPRGGSVSDAIILFAEDKLADFVIMASAELSRPGKEHIGSVSKGVAKGTGAHVLVAKTFA